MSVFQGFGVPAAIADCHCADHDQIPQPMMAISEGYPAFWEGRVKAEGKETCDAEANEDVLQRSKSLP